MSEEKVTLKNLIKEIGFRLTHIEDMEADNRALIVKLVTQGNTIVEFLKQLDSEELPIEEDFYPSKSIVSDNNKGRDIKELISEFMEKREELKEFEDELRKHKDKITPGQIGEA